MSKFLSAAQLYQTLQQESQNTKETLWICSTQLGRGAHEILPQEIIANPPQDIRFLFTLNDDVVKAGQVNPHEVQYLMEHLQNSAFKAHDALPSNMYLFDETVLITSAPLTIPAFQLNQETGVLLEEPQEVDSAKRFFISLWADGRPLKDVRRYKKISPPTLAARHGKIKPHTKIKPWTDDHLGTWYFSVQYDLKKRSIKSVFKEANWPGNLRFVGDIGPRAYKQVKMGDVVLLADLAKRGQPSVRVHLARIYDKCRVETDDGDLHLACSTEKTYTLRRNRFQQMIQDAGIGIKDTEILLVPEQIKTLLKVLTQPKTRPIPKLATGTAKPASKKAFLAKTGKKKPAKKKASTRKKVSAKKPKTPSATSPNSADARKKRSSKKAVAKKTKKTKKLKPTSVIDTEIIVHAPRPRRTDSTQVK